MEAYLRRIYRRRLNGLFEGEDLDTVLSWLSAKGNALPVVVVGAGYSRNAVRKQDGEPATKSQVPLWRDISEALATDIGLDEWSAYSAPALAQLYFDQLGRAAFVNRLRRILADGSIGPGPAHEALLAYDAVAVITTNNLDTLLDRNDGVVSVVQDADLSADRMGQDLSSPAARQVIYFHGHRTQPDSWVFTRNQYEDHPSRVPVLRARVRQLLAMHPALCVGFSLSDPNFHHVYRGLARAMNFHQPLGLAVFPPGATILPAQRIHWERVGLRIAALRGGQQSSSAFRDLFNQLGSLNTANSTEELKPVLRDVADLGDRVDLAQRWLRAGLGGDGSGSASSLAEDPPPSLGNDPRFGRVRAGDLRNLLLTSLEFDLRPGEDGGNSFRDPPLRSNLSVLPEQRFRLPSRLVSVVDRWLEWRSAPERAESPSLFGLVAWFELLVRHGSWEFEAGSESFVVHDLAAWVTRRYLESTGESDSGLAERRRRATELLLLCHAYVKRHGFDPYASHVSEDAATLKLDGDEALTLGDWVGLLKRGNEQFQNDELEKASESFRQAQTAAAKADEPVATWLAILGRQNSQPVSFALDNEPHRLRSELRAAKAHPVVAALDRTIRDRSETLRRQTLQEFDAILRRRDWGDHSMHWTSAPEDQIRLYRSLEAQGAPPGLLRQVLEPLLAYEHAVPEARRRLTVEESISWRLHVGARNTGAWLRDLRAAREGGHANRGERDRKVCRVLLRQDGTLRELEARVEAAVSIPSFLRDVDVAPAEEFLRYAARRLFAKPGFAHGGPEMNFVDAVLRLTHWMSFDEATHFYSEVLVGVSPSMDRHRALRRWPWSVWAQETSVDTLARWAVNRMQEVSHRQATTKTEVQDEGATWAMVSILEEKGAEGLADETGASILECAARQLAHSHSTFAANTRASRWLYLLLDNDGSENEQTWYREAEAALDDNPSPSTAWTTWALLADAFCTARLRGKRPALHWRKTAQKWCKVLDELEDDLRRRIQLNPGQEQEILYATRVVLVENMTSQARQVALTILDASRGNGVDQFASSARREVWDARLNEFAKVLRTSALSDDISVKMSWYRFVQHISPDDVGGLRGSLGFFFSQVPFGIGDDRLYVATAAARATGAMARWRTDGAETRFIAQGLGQAVADVRTEVRAAAAFHLGKLAATKHLPDEEPLGGKLVEFCNTLANDPYLIVQVNFQRGLLMGRHEAAGTRSRSSSGEP